MTEAINSQQQPQQPSKPAHVEPSGKSTIGNTNDNQQLNSTNQTTSKPQAASKEYGTEYYKGLIASDLSRTNGSSAGDMLRRNLQLAGMLAL
jgi:hypothetical protein